MRRWRRAGDPPVARPDGSQDGQPGGKAEGQPRIGPAVVDDATIHVVLDLALRIGELELAGGAGAADVTATILGVTNAYGLPRCEVDVILTSITVCCHRGLDSMPVTSSRLVGKRSLDYTRLAGIDELVRRITTGEIAALDAHAELEAISSGERRYPRWLATLSWSGMAAAVAVLLGGSPVVALVAAGTTGCIDRVGRLLNRRALPLFFQQVAGATLATGATVALFIAGLIEGTDTAIVVGAGLIVLLSGFAVVGTVLDGITGFYVTAAGRAFEVMLMSAGLLAGVAVTLQISAALRVNVALSEYAAPELGALLVQVPAAAATATFFALASYAPIRALPGAALAGAAGWVCFDLLFVAGAGRLTSSAMAAVLVGMAGRVVSRRLRLPPLVVAVSGITPLLPGLQVYRGLFQLAVLEDLTGVSTLLGAAATALALAAGVALGEFLSRPVRTGLGRLERRLAGPRLVGPLRPDRPDRRAQRNDD